MPPMEILKSVSRNQSFVTVAVSNELSFNFDLFSITGIDLSRGLLHGEIPTSLSGLQGLGIPEFII